MSNCKFCGNLSAKAERLVCEQCQDICTIRDIYNSYMFNKKFSRENYMILNDLAKKYNDGANSNKTLKYFSSVWEAVKANGSCDMRLNAKYITVLSLIKEHL